MRYLLDTNICIYITKKNPIQVFTRMDQLQPGDAGMSVITYFELVYGAWKSQRAQENLARIERLQSLIPPQPLDIPTADHYGRLRTDLERRGVRIGDYDLLIAAQAVSLGLTLVTNNVGEFGRIKGLRVENWAE